MKKIGKKSIKISLIAAIDEKLGIGKNNKIPWDIPEDRKWFKKVTEDHVVIMGENTYKSILEAIGRPLPNRTNIVLTLDNDFSDQRVLAAYSITDALNIASRAEEGEEVFVIGGASVYKQFIDIANRLYLTKIKGNFKADTFFPRYDKFNKIVYSQKAKDHKYEYEFLILEKHGQNI